MDIVTATVKVFHGWSVLQSMHMTMSIVGDSEDREMEAILSRGADDLRAVLRVMVKSLTADEMLEFRDLKEEYRDMVLSDTSTDDLRQELEDMDVDLPDVLDDMLDDILGGEDKD